MPARCRFSRRIESFPMATPKVVRFPMARPRIVRTKEEAAAVPLHLPIQVEFRTDPVLETELSLMENELRLAEQLVAAKRRVVELLREAVFKD
jgi:hypothetical protein